MKLPSKKARPTIRTPTEDAYPASTAPWASARIYVEVDAGRGQWVTFDIKIAVHSRDVNDFAPVVNALETRSAELSDDYQPNEQQPDDPEHGPYVYSVITGEPVRMRRPKRGWRKFGRR
jgi:hypothetical protein